ncbi:Hypothetical protein PHPALM_414 [Phytophthora palmivora]|uniref:Uncharacterized protein n=1 Tax=Phytophthora palmivora TaxID=4796 RepID=A0A2P4YUY1_9STRA|nr:Hypothetical protein PHPALM_414 [Phytophthora palmivora]
MVKHGGHQVAVSYNGQSLYAAFFLNVQPLPYRVTLDDTDVATLNAIKKNVLNVILAKLRYDIQLELLQAQKDLAVDRFVSTSSSISKRARAPEHKLRAMAVFSRKPIYVWTIGDAGVIRVVQYSTHTNKMQDGDIHEMVLLWNSRRNQLASL